MTKKEQEVLAQAIRKARLAVSSTLFYPAEAVDFIMHQIGKGLAKSDPKFKKYAFYKACKVGGQSG